MSDEDLQRMVPQMQMANFPHLANDPEFIAEMITSILDEAIKPEQVKPYMQYSGLVERVWRGSDLEAFGAAVIYAALPLPRMGALVGTGDSVSEAKADLQKKYDVLWKKIMAQETLTEDEVLLKGLMEKRGEILDPDAKETTETEPDSEPEEDDDYSIDLDDDEESAANIPGICSQCGKKLKGTPVFRDKMHFCSENCANNPFAASPTEPTLRNRR